MTNRAAVRRCRLVALAALFGVLSVPLSAGTAHGSDAARSGVSPSKGGSETPFTFARPAGHCRRGESPPGSIETAYIFPLSADPGSAYWAASDRPIGGHDIHAHHSPNRKPALRFAGTPLAPGIYHVGVTCLESVDNSVHPREARFTNRHERTYDTLVAITANSKDPNGFTWNVCTTPPAELAEAPVAIALPLVGAFVVGAFAAVRRRRNHSLRRTSRSM
jgi:hypothetical protein